MISALQPMRPLPFPIVYILGMGEDLFPGSNALSSVRPARRAAHAWRCASRGKPTLRFPATNLAAEQKLYLLYNNHDLQKDQPLLPAVRCSNCSAISTAISCKTIFKPSSCRRTR